MGSRQSHSQQETAGFALSDREILCNGEVPAPYEVWGRRAFALFVASSDANLSPALTAPVLRAAYNFGGSLC